MFSPEHSDQQWSTRPSLLHSVCRVIFPWEKGGLEIKLNLTVTKLTVTTQTSTSAPNIVPDLLFLPLT
jgi:hypothetical protein